MDSIPESDPEAKRQFYHLKSFCISLMRQKNQSCISSLREEIISMQSLTPLLVDYVIFPLRITLQQAVRSDVHLVESTVMCMGVVLNKSRVKSNQTFHEILSILCLMLDHRTPPSGSQISNFGGVGLKSEELITSVLSTIQSLLLHSNESVLSSLYSNLPALGHAVSVILDILEKQNSRVCQLTAIHSLISLSSCDSTQWKQLIANDTDVTNIGIGSGGRRFASFLPGITMSLCKLAVSGVHIGQSVIQLSILGWIHFVTLIVNSNEHDNSDITDERLVVHCTKEWWIETDKHLEKLSSRIGSLVKHVSWQVRIGLCYWANQLITKCIRNLPNTCGPALEVIVTLTCDEYSLVSNAANKTLEIFSQILEETGVSNLTSVIEEKLFNLSSILPRIMRDTDEGNKLVVLRLLKGYLQLLGSHVSQLTFSYAHMTRLIQALVQTVLIDTRNISIQETKTTSVWIEEKKDDELLLPNLSYIHLREEQSVMLIQSICSILGEHGQSDILLDYMIQQCTGSTHQRSELLVILHWILCGIPDNIHLDAVVEGMLQVREEGQGGVYDDCLVLCILAECCRKLKEKFIIHLQYVLSIVMECISSNNSTISNTAIATAKSISKHCGYNTISGLINGCADYLVDHIAIQLIHPSLYVQGCLVLQTIITYGTYTILPLITDCKNALLLSLDQWCSVSESWSVLHALAKRLKDWIELEESGNETSIQKDEDEVKNSETEETFEKKDMDSIGHYFLEYHTKKQENEEMGDLSEERDGPEEEVNNEATDKVPPPAVQAGVDIIQRCTHHLSSTDNALRLVILECLELSLIAMKPVQRVLLPEVHNIWSAFTHRLIDNYLPARTKAIEVIKTMAIVCQDFLRRRVVKEVWPKLIQSLEQLLPGSRNPSAIYQYSFEYKLLIMIIRVISQLCVQLGVSVSECEEAVVACVTYLSSHTPKEIQRVCVETLSVLAKYDPDMIWIVIVQLSPDLFLSSPPHHSLKHIKLPQCSTEEYFENLKELFQVL